MTTNKLTAGLWGLLAVLALSGVLFSGAWWHLLTCAFCLLFYALFRESTTNAGGE